MTLARNEANGNLSPGIPSELLAYLRRRDRTWSELARHGYSRAAVWRCLAAAVRCGAAVVIAGPELVRAYDYGEEEQP
jgi:hypothetical protein